MRNIPELLIGMFPFVTSIVWFTVKLASPSLYPLSTSYTMSYTIAKKILECLLSRAAQADS